MYSILLSIAVAAIFILTWGLVPLPGGWGLGIFLGLVAMVGVWIYLARRLRRQIEPGFKAVQRQAEAGMTPAAISSLEAMLPLGKWMPLITGQIYAQIGVFAYHMGDRTKAIESLEKSSKRASEGQMLLAAIHYKNGDADRAMNVLEKAIPFNKRNVLLYHFYAWILQKEGDVDGAIAVINRHLAKEAGDESSQKNILRLQNGNKLNMAQFGMPWFALGFERPPASMGQMQQARKGFRQPPKARGKRKRQS